MPTLLAQCAAGLSGCDLPHTLPWYFGLAIGAVWAAAVVGAALLLRRRWILRRRARRDERGTRKQLGESRGTDVEIW